MNSKIIPWVMILIVIILTMGMGFNSFLTKSPSDIVCYEDSSHYVWSPIGTRSENFNWICLRCGGTWTKSYPEELYEGWRNAFLEPEFVREYTLLYLREVKQMDVPDPLTLDWTGGRETPEDILGYEKYIYGAGNLSVTIGYPVVLPEDTKYDLDVEVGGRTFWEGQLHRREFLESNQPPALYDYYGGVGLFTKGIHVTATGYNPLISWENLSDRYDSVNDYWSSLQENVTNKASTEDFISIIISRGDKPTGGYSIQVNLFSWLESYPVIFRFSVDFTDPGEGVAVTEALTNPLVVVPLGKLSPGEYEVEVQIDRYIMTLDEHGNPVYTRLKTFSAEIWKQTFTIE